MSDKKPVIIKSLGLCDYQSCLESMQQFTQQRDDKTVDEIWIVEHPPVYTQGQAGKPEHILNAKNIPIVQADRGGQVTYHAPGQVVIYTMLNLHRLNLGIKSLVCILEKSVLEYLSEFDIQAQTDRNAPGVYINGAKICSLGLRVKHGCTYHGLAFNVDMDLEPFQRINPCGFSNLVVTQLSDFAENISTEQAAHSICQYIVKNLGYNDPH